MLKAYLAGSIESKLDGGTRWRDALFSRLVAIGITPLDPTRHLQTERGAEWAAREQALQDAKARKDEKAFMRIMHEIWVMNKRGVDEADFLIAYAENYNQLSGGTTRELHEAYLYRKPVFLVFSGDPFQLKSHLLHMVLGYGKWFPSFDALFAYLKEHVVSNPEFKPHYHDLFHVSQKVFMLDEKQQLLMIKTVNSPYYDMPGGRVDFDEFETDLRESVLREVKEELGDDIQFDIEATPVVVDREHLWDKVLRQFHFRRVFLVFYEARYRGGAIKLSSEHESYQWVPLNTLNPRDFFKPGTARAAQKCIERFFKK